MRSLLCTLICFGSVLSAADPVLGKWKLNVEKSTYFPGPAPKTQTRLYEAVGDGVRVTIRTEAENGNVTVVEHPLNYDGKEQPVRGSRQSDAIALQRVDEYTSESVMKHASKIIGTNRRVVARDGKTMTITYEGLDSSGRQAKIVAVYDRQ